MPRSIWILGWVSLATDTASEAIYPILPFFLTGVLGASALSLGVIEGMAEAVNSLLKLLSGQLADRTPAKRPLVIAGYALSSLVRPLISVAQSWPAVFGVRFIDRVGKGVRGAPRDAMLAAIATPETRGRVYGFHRGMDHAGAVLGPVLASLFLLAYPGRYRLLFALTIVPGLVAVALLFLVREPTSGAARVTAAPSRTAGPSSVALPASLKRFLAILSLFTLGNSTDAYLLLRLTDAAGSATFIPIAWSALHVVKSASSFLAGAWSDRIGRGRVIALGWCVYALVYVGFAVSHSLPALLAWFLTYGLYFGLTEGVERALIADLAPHAHRGRVFGLYTAIQGIGSLAASLLFGVLWTTYGPAVAFGIGAALAAISTCGLLALSLDRREPRGGAGTAAETTSAQV